MNLNTALALPPIPPHSSKLPQAKRCAVITLDRAAVTDAASECPVIANWGTSTCFAIFFYDRERKRLGALHATAPDEAVKRLADLVREDHKERLLECYIVGGMKLKPDEQSVVSVGDARRLIRMVTEEIPNVTLLHVDLFHKHRTPDHAMDARTGEFFYLKKDRQSLTRQELLTKFYPDKQPFYGQMELVYDGSKHPFRQSIPLGPFTAKEQEKQDGSQQGTGR